MQGAGHDGWPRWLRLVVLPASVFVLALALVVAWSTGWAEGERRLMLGAGVVFAVLLAALVFVLATAHERAKAMAERMTRALRDSEQRWVHALEGTGDGLWDWQVKDGTFSTSTRAKDILGWLDPLDDGSRRSAGRSLRRIQSRMHPDDRARVQAELRRCLKAQCERFNVEFRMQGRLGAHEWNWVQARGTVALRDRRARPLRMLGTVTDINARRRSEEHVRFLALHDPLTELANRAQFDERMQFALAHARRYGECLGIILIDLDNFKTVNDQHGHAVGDQLLQTVARRVRGSVRETDTAARIGGDEFMVLLTGPLSREAARLVAEKIYSQVAQPVDIGGVKLEITASLGLALYPSDGLDATTLAKAADDAMYRGKRAGRQLYGEPRQQGFTEF